MDLLSPLPIQVDGEAWAQPPGTMSIVKLPDAATLLQGSSKASTYGRQTSKKEIALLHTVSTSEILFSEGLSTRRQVSDHPVTISEEEPGPEKGAEGEEGQ